MDNLTRQFVLAWHLQRMSKNFDISFFDVGEYRNPLPTLVAKLLGKKTVVFHRGGNQFLEARIESGSGSERLVPFIQEFLMRLSYCLVDHIVCEADSIIEFGGLERYRRKILIFGFTIDTDRFQIRKDLAQRENLVGHFGRLTPKKGIINLVRAVPLVLRERSNVRFLIAGIGPERERIEQEIQVLGVKDRVTLSSFVPHEELPDFLNQLRLFVLPSYEEGVPTVLLEAMASGVVVLATPVGGIPDVVRDGETGFILENNTPELVAEAILGALAHPDLERIARQGRDLIESERSFEVGVAGWKKILQSIGVEDKAQA
jgi:glycosyltransferase involved in cell wall biosynthesis